MDESCKQQMRDGIATNLSRSCRWAALAITLALVLAEIADPAWAQKPAQPSTTKPRDLLGEKEIPGGISCVLTRA